MQRFQRFGEWRVGAAFAALLCLSVVTLLNAQQPVNVMPKSNTTEVTASFSPQGEASDVQQLVLRFSRDMVRLGEGNSAAAPATLACAPAQSQLKGRWIDTTRYAWEAPQPLAVGVRCEVTLRAGLKALDGGAVQGAGPWKLSTGGPKLVEQWPYQGAQVTESQTFFLRANAPLDRASVAANLRCEIKNQAARTLILLSDADTATELRKQRRDLSAAQIKAQGWIGLRCGTEDLPNDAALRFMWGKGIATLTGVSSASDQIVGYTVRPAFTARLVCTVLGDEKKDEALQGCDPRAGLRVEFSERVAPLALKAISLQSAGKAVKFITNDDEGDNKQARGAFATGPLDERSTLNVSLKDTLRDVDGRALSNPQALTRNVAFGELPPYVGMLSTQATLPLAPRAGEAATWPLVVRRAGASVPLQLWRVGGETANAQALAYLLKQSWMRQLSDPQARGEAMPAKALLADAAFKALPLPTVSKRELSTRNNGMEFVGLKLAEPGVYLIEADHAAARKANAANKGNALSTALVQVTNLHVAFKAPAQGTQGAALVWVTALDSGKPVSGASVTLLGCDDARVLHEGSTDAQGRLNISAAQLDAARQKGLCAEANNRRPAADTGKRSMLNADINNRIYNDSSESIGLIVVRQDRDIALLGVGIGMVRPLDAQAAFTPEMMSGLISHSVLDRTLFKAGETLNMQHLIRRGTAQGYEVPTDLLKQRATLQLFFGGGEKVADMPVSFDNTGSATNAWKIPANAKLGSYYGQLSFGDPSGAHQVTHSISFQVEEYRAPVFEARMSGAQMWRSGKAELPIDMSLSFLAGGAASGQAVTLRGELMEGAASPIGYARYQFSDDTAPAFSPAKLAALKLTLDASGKGSRVLSAASNAALFSNARPATLRSEMQFNDANGETQTIAQSYAIWPRERKLGITAQVLPNSAGSTKPTASIGVEISAVMLDAKNATVLRAAVKITAQRAVWKYANGRQRLELIGEPQGVCDSTTDANGAVRCIWRAPDEASNVTPSSGNDSNARSVIARPRTAPETMWLLRASSDEQTSTATTTLNSWQWRYTPNDAVLQIEGQDARNPEQAMEPESNARLLVRSPYEQSTLLLTIEREGVLTSSVHQLSSREHRLDLRVLGNYAPNVMINARIIRGLHAVPEAEFGGSQGSVNPAMFARSRGMGRIMPPWPGSGGVSPVAQSHTLALRVKPSAFTLKLDVTPAQTSFRPRDQAPVAITVRGADGKPAANARVTLAVVDEALLALQANPTWAVLEAMTRERYAPMNANANDSGFTWRVKLGEAADYVPGDEASRLRSVDAIAAPMTMAAAAPAAAGRMMAKSSLAQAANFAQDPSAPPPPAPAETPPPRSNFTTLAMWKTDVTTDANGKAQVTVPLPDSLTRWRVVAIASYKADQFGTAEASFTTTQPLQVVSGLPLSVRSGDALTQTLTLRNTSDKAMNVSLAARATPSFARYATSRAMPAEAALRETGLLYTQTVALAAGENQLIAWPVAVPSDAELLKWQISAKADKASDAIEITQVVTSAAPVTVRQSTLVQAAPKIEIPVAQPNGALPLQGGVSVAWQASLADAALSEVREWMKEYPFACLEQKASKLSVANDRAGWDALMSELPKYLDDKGLPRFFPLQQGQAGSNTVPGSETLAVYLIDIARLNSWSMPVEPRNQMLNALKLALDKKLPEQDWAPTKNDTARLLSLQATLMEAGVIKAPQVILNDADKLPTVSLLDWVRALLVQPASANRTAQLNDAANLLRNRYNVQGTRLLWRNEERENWWWYMWNGNVAAARTVLVVNQWAQFDESWKKDLPLLVKGLTARQQQGHWGTTTANVWGAIALQTFAKQTEAGLVSGSSLAEMGAQKVSSTWATKKDPEPVMLPWPQQGAQDVLKLSHQGTGTPWATVSVMAAMKLDKPTSQGMTIKRSILPVQQQTKGQWRVGDVMRVKVEMSSAAELNWVVMRDPVPSGATVLGRGLARESGLAQQGQRSTGWAWPVYEERAAESYRAYYARAPRGNWSAEYTVRLNNAGKFAFPASRLEAMYAPEIFAETPIEGLEVKP